MRHSLRLQPLTLLALGTLCIGALDAATAAENRRPLVETICPLMEKEAEANGISPHFFVRLIWRESRFRPDVVSHKGAQGIAQFMPATAKERGLENPFDPETAIPHSARLLADLKRDLGNIGLAAAAYNAGAERVRGWLAGERTLPAETVAYVRFTTGRPADDWKTSGTALPDELTPKKGTLQDACRKLAPTVVHALIPKAPAAPKSSWRPWGVQIAVNFSRPKVEAIFRQLKERHTRLLADSEAMFVSDRNLSRGTRSMVALRLGADSREAAQKLCERLRADGGVCTVQKN